MRYLRCPGGVAWVRACENINGLGLLSTCAAQEAEAAERSRGAARVPGIWEASLVWRRWSLGASRRPKEDRPQVEGAGRGAGSAG